MNASAELHSALLHAYVRTHIHVHAPSPRDTTAKETREKKEAKRPPEPRRCRRPGKRGKMDAKWRKR